VNEPAQSPAKELIISPCREWQAAAASAIIGWTGEHLAWSVSPGVNGPDPADARSGVNALAWSQAEGSGLLTYAPFPEYGGPAASYGNDPSGSLNEYPAGLWPGTSQPAPWGNEQCPCSGAWLAWVAVLSPPYAESNEAYGLHAQTGFWVHLSNSMLGLGPNLNPNGVTLALRSRYRLDTYVTGFRASCEIWAFNSLGNPGWNGGVIGDASSFRPRNVAWLQAIAPGVNLWREVPVPLANSGSDTYANGLVGLAQFDFWGLTPAQWSAGTIGHTPISGAP